MSNLAISSLRVGADPGAGSRGVAFDAEVANFSDDAAKVELQLAVADRVVARGTLELSPRERKIKRFLATLPPGTRATDASVALAGDNLAIDDRRHASVNPRDEVRVLLVNGDPRTVRIDDELVYLESALRPGDISEFDVVVLANVPALPPARAGVLARWVTAGGGILIAPGDRVDPAAYDRTMLPLMPQSLRDPIDTTWGAPANERASRALRLVKWEADHPIFAPFPKDAPGLSDAKFYKILLLGPTTTTAERKVLARFTNGAAALVEASIGAGRTLLFTSTLDRDWNDLPIHRGFLPLVQQAVRHLARKHVTGGDTSRGQLVGSAVALPAGDLKRLEVRGPDGLGAVYEGDRIAGRTSVRFGRTDRPGIYRVVGLDQTGATREREELAFAINVDPRGSDLTAAPPAALPESGTGGGAAPTDTRRRVELWHALAALVLLLMLVEGVLVQR
jgi:hypothetical protein